MDGHDPRALAISIRNSTRRLLADTCKETGPVSDNRFEAALVSDSWSVTAGRRQHLFLTRVFPHQSEVYNCLSLSQRAYIGCTPYSGWQTLPLCQNGPYKADRSVPESKSNNMFLYLSIYTHAALLS